MSKRSSAAKPRRRYISYSLAKLLFIGIIGCLAAVTAETRAQSANGPTRLLRTPTVSSSQIAFAYANNIWTVSRSGGNAHRVTSFQGQTFSLCETVDSELRFTSSSCETSSG